MTKYLVTDEKARAIARAAVNVEAARRAADEAHENLCKAMVYVEQNSGWDPISAFTWTGGSWHSTLGKDDERFAIFLDALDDRRAARRQLGARRAALTRLVRSLEVKE